MAEADLPRTRAGEVVSQRDQQATGADPQTRGATTFAVTWTPHGAVLGMEGATTSDHPFVGDLMEQEGMHGNAFGEPSPGSAPDRVRMFREAETYQVDRRAPEKRRRPGWPVAGRQ